MSLTLEETNERVRQASGWVTRLRETVGQVVVGQQALVDRLLVGLLANGHVLLEGVPGLAKTLSVRTLAAAIHASFSRIQFTPDLLPADIMGTLIYNPSDGKYHATKGPIFANIVLADEINRAPAKVQSALLEAMQERQVTLGGEANPLPEAQVDRFMMKVIIGYPTFEEERKILDTMAFTRPKLDVERVIDLEEIVHARSVVDSIHVDEKIRDYVVHVVFATRTPEKYGLDIGRMIEFGASPRATINLTLAAKAWALLNGRSYVIPDDIKAIGPDVLRHRIIPSYEAEAQGKTTDHLVRAIFDHVPVP
jgi:MoxR-like ATPase